MLYKVYWLPKSFIQNIWDTGRFRWLIQGGSPGNAYQQSPSYLYWWIMCINCIKPARLRRMISNWWLFRIWRHEFLLLLSGILCYLGGHVGEAMCGRRSYPPARYEAGGDIPIPDTLVLCGVGSGACREQPNFQRPCARKVMQSWFLYYYLCGFSSLLFVNPFEVHMLFTVGLLFRFFCILELKIFL